MLWLKPKTHHALLKRVAPLLPALLTLALIFLSLLPRRFFVMAEVAPLLMLGSVYYWVMFRPKLMPIWAVFLLGLALDALTGPLLGLSSFLLMLLWLAIGTQRKTVTRQTFKTMWFAFALFSAGYVLLYWLLLSVSYYRELPLHAALLQWALTVGCYPPLHMLCNRIYRVLPR